METSILVVRSSLRYLIFFACCTFLQVDKTFAEEKGSGQLILEDRGFFRINKKVFYGRELLNIIEDFQLLSCVFPDSIVFDSIQRHQSASGQWPNWIELKNEVERLQGFHSKGVAKKFSVALQGVLLLKKLMLYIETQSVKRAPGLLAEVKKASLTCSVAKRSGGKVENLSSGFVQMLDLEIYLRSRFLEKSYYIAPEKLQGLSEKERKQKRERLEKQRQQSALKGFFLSIQRQIKERWLIEGV